MANKPVIYQGDAYSVGSYTLAAPTAGTNITRIITSIKISNVINSPAFAGVSITWNGVSLFGSGNFLSGDNIIEYNDQFIVQNDDPAHAINVTSTLSFPTNRTMVTIQGVEINRADDSEIGFFGYNQSVVGQFIGSGVASTQRAIIKQLHIADLSGAPGVFRVGTNQQLGEGNYNLVPVESLGKTYIEDLNAVVSNENNSILVVTAPTPSTSFEMVYFGTIITL